MKKIALIFGLICLVVLMGVSGCGLPTDTYEKVAYAQLLGKQETHVAPNVGRFVIVSAERINDGSLNGLWIYTIVDRHTKVVYMYTEKYHSGYGVGLHVLLDAEGKPLLYEGEL